MAHGLLLIYLWILDNGCLDTVEIGDHPLGPTHLASETSTLGCSAYTPVNKCLMLLIREQCSPLGDDISVEGKCKESR
jgi:hypothetical protein